LKAGKNNQASYSHTYIEDNYAFQLFGKVLYAVKNLRRRLIIGAFDKLETMSYKEVCQHFKEIRDRNCYLKPLVDAKIIGEKEKDLYKITSFGKGINKAINGVKELNLLPIPKSQKLYSELVLLELRAERKTYRELKSKLNLSDAYKVMHQIITRLENAELIKVSHPHNLPSIPYLFHFTLSPYYHFIEGLKSYVEKTDRPWFTEYTIITHLNLKWQAIFGRPMKINEARELLEKGMAKNAILKKDGSYEVSIEELRASLNNLMMSEKKILGLIKEGPKSASMIAEKSGFHYGHVHKILKRLEKRNLVEKYIEYVTVELTEKGERLAGSLFKIKECVTREIGWEV